jgi:hypothetical protein
VLFEIEPADPSIFFKLRSHFCPVCRFERPAAQFRKNAIDVTDNGIASDSVLDSIPVRSAT